MDNKHKIILASKSPRRAEILRMIGLDFKVVPSKIKEKINPNIEQNEIAIAISKAKAEKISCKYPTDIIIGADTIVVLNGKIFGKPKDLWRRRKPPSTQARDGMMKVATQFGVPGKKDGQKRKVEDVAEDLEPRMLSQGRTMLRDSAEKPSTLEELQAWLATCTEDMCTGTPPLKRLKTAVDV